MFTQYFYNLARCARRFGEYQKKITIHKTMKKTIIEYKTMRHSNPSPNSFSSKLNFWMDFLSPKHFFMFHDLKFTFFPKFYFSFISKTGKRLKFLTPSFFTFYTPYHLHSLPFNNSTRILRLLLTTIVLFDKIQHPTLPLLFHILISFMFLFLRLYINNSYQLKLN
jgi:hypothetical protein